MAVNSAEGSQRSSPLLTRLLGLGLAALLTLLALEAALQAAWHLLPAAVIEKMPQYLERSGFQLATEHGARQYPAGQIIDYEITASSGDLYRLSCLSPDEAPPFDDYRVSFQRDAFGFRNTGQWPDKAQLVILGDSFVAAEAIVDPFWRELADDMLALGLPGSGSLEQQRLYEAFAAPRQPDTLVLAYFAGNDLADNAEFAEMLARGETFAARAHEGKHPLDYSVLFNLALLIVRSLEPGDSERCHYPQLAQTAPPQPVAFYEAFLPVMALDMAALMESESAKATRDSIAAMAAEQQARGSRFLLLYIPQKAELYWPWLSDDSKSQIVSRPGIADPRAIDANLSVQRDWLEALAAELGVEFLDLSGPLAGAIARGERPYFFADTHWNQLGHNLARNALLERLNQSTLDS